MGIERLIEIQQARDKGIVGEDIQKAIDKLENKKPPSQAKLYVAKIMSEGFYSYLKLRRLLGVPKDSFTITPLRGQRFADCMGLINPGGHVWVKEGSYSVLAKVEIKADVGVEGAGPAAILTTSSAIVLIELDSRMFGALRNVKLNMNSIATKGVHIKDSWYSDIRHVYITGVPAFGFGVHVNLATNALGCYHNKIFARIIGVAQAAGSVGIKTETTAPATYTPNANMFTGRLKHLIMVFR